MINRKIDNYTIKRLIGQGGMADVYYAENRLGKPAAIKILKKKFTGEPAVHDRFIQEAEIMVQLDHPHICKIYDISELDGQAAIIMEYLEGETFRQAIDRDKGIESNTLEKYFEQCVDALKYTHHRGIVHRDIKPSNIFITKDDQIKLMDFGIAKVKDGVSHTNTGQTLGTIIYMSPEQIKDPKRVTEKTDVYSLAVTMYHALTGHAPYDLSTDSDFNIQLKIVQEDLHLDRINELWRTRLLPMLSKDPAQRIALDKLTDSSSSQDSKPTTSYGATAHTQIVDTKKTSQASSKKSQISKPKETSSKSYKPWIIAIVGFLVVLIGGLSIKQCSSEGINPSQDNELVESAGDSITTETTPSTTTHTDEQTTTNSQPSLDSETNNEADLAAWNAAKYSNTIASYQFYLNQYPSGTYRSDASMKISQLEKQIQVDESKQADLAAWNTAEYSNTITSYQFYLNQYPSGTYRSDASMKISQLEKQIQVDESKKADLAAWNAAKYSNTIASYQFYQKQFPSGTYHDAANKKIKQLKKQEQEDENKRYDMDAWNRAMSINSIASYEQYISRFPSGKYRIDANQKIIDLSKPTVNLTSAQRQAITEIRNGMIRIPSGTFTMGCTSEQGSDCEVEEKPAHTVSLSAFYLHKYEVTQSQWQAIMGNNPSKFSGCNQCPVESVSWNDIQDFLTKLNQLSGENYKLPTEAQWEYAARGGQSYVHAGSNKINSVGWNNVNSGNKTHPVGQKQANGFGLFDMTGNVWEWCQDWHDSSYYNYSPSRNPHGPSSGTSKVLRGGSWGNFVSYCRVTYRVDYSPTYHYSSYGFRLSRT